MKPTRRDVEALFERETIVEVIPSRDLFITRMLSGTPFHIYLGIDPTAEKIHLGHVQNILFLEDMRKLGAKVTLLFGSFTGLIGDPTEKESSRPQLTPAQVRKNMRTWKKQVAPILQISRFGNASITYNNRWFDSFSLADFLKLMSETTVQQLLERDMFQKRLRDGKPLHAHEMVYPILQGYDSVAMKVDAELCGTDQTFNALFGRTMVQKHLGKEKFVVSMNLIQANGVLMSKSTGTGVFVDIEPGGNDRMFGGVMALPDGFIIPLFCGCTRVPMEEITHMDTGGGVKTRDHKLHLAREIVAMFWGGKRAQEAEERYIQQFREKEVPDNAERIGIPEDGLLFTVVAEHAAASNADARRKFEQGAVSLNGKKMTDIRHTITEKDRATRKEHILRVGRTIFILW